MIQDGKRFKGPVELVQHHERILDGFLTRPRLACDRQPDQPPMAWPGVTMHELEMIIIDKASNSKVCGGKYFFMVAGGGGGVVCVVFCNTNS